jgi:hypothetical protein
VFFDVFPSIGVYLASFNPPMGVKMVHLEEVRNEPSVWSEETEVERVQGSKVLKSPKWLKSSKWSSGQSGQSG